MLYTKGIECILRAILCPESHICLVCKDDREAIKCMDNFKNIFNSCQIKPEISDDNQDVKIAFKNGSYIHIAKPREKEEVIRGKRAKIIPDCGDWYVPNDVLEEVLKPFIKKDEK